MVMNPCLHRPLPKLWPLTTTLLLLALLSKQSSLQVSSQTLGWIVAGSNKTVDGVPSCSYCINVINANALSSYEGAAVGLYRCLKFDGNEQWAVDNTTHAIQVKDPASNQFCIEATSQPDYSGRNITFLPLRLRLCDGSPKQQWFFDSATKSVRSGLTAANASQVYMVQGELPSSEDPHTAAVYNLYLSTLQAPGYINSQFTFQASSNLRRYQNDSGAFFLRLRAADPTQQQQEDNLIYNGGFERSTLLPNWPAGVNCSTSTWSAACSKCVLFNGELFSLCSWAAGVAGVTTTFRWPLWLRNRGLWNPADGDSSTSLVTPSTLWKPAEGNSSLLLPNGVSINQTIPTVTNVGYLLSFALAGYLAFADTSDNYQLCFNQTSGYVLVQATSSQGGNLASGTYLVDHASVYGRDTQWFSKTLKFIASGSATAISFSSVSFASDCGPVIDNVRVSLDASLPSSNSRSNHVKVVLGATVSLLIVAGVLIALALFWWRRRHKRSSAHQYLAPDAVHAVRVISLSEIRRATGDWSKVLGQGGFSTVYRADFPDGIVRAVKVEKNTPSKRSVFLEEVMLLQRVNHRTLVNLVGFCAEEGQRILVFEYLPNGTLHQRLHSNEPADKDTYVKLSWETRMRIVHQVACALDYLHHGTSPPLVHRDIKSANILLTANDSAKLADFGLAKSAQPDATSFQSVNTDIKGSHGYLDPSYVRSSLYSPKCDVYSYGVVVLEIVTGRPAMKDWGLLSEWAAEYLNDPLRVHEMVDERLSGDFSTTDLRILVDLVKLCLQDDPQARPTMQQVLSFLSDSQLSGCASTALGPVPDGLCMEPSPSSEQSSIPKGSSSSSSAAFSY